VKQIQAVSGVLTTGFNDSGNCRGSAAKNIQQITRNDFGE
jgi:hypothetical protein